MAISFVSSTTRQSSGATRADLTRPAGLAAGDVMFAFLVVESTVTITPPAGWTVIHDHIALSGSRAWVGWKAAGGSEPTSYRFDFNLSKAYVASIGAWRSVDNTAPVDDTVQDVDTGNTAVAPTVTAAAATRLVGLFGHRNQTAKTPDMTTPAGMTDRAEITGNSYRSLLIADQDVSAGATGTRTSVVDVGALDGGWFAALVALSSDNSLPNAPALTSPAGNVILDRAVTTTLKWTHSDPDADPQSDAEVRYKPTASGSWTTVTGKGAAATHAITADSLAAGTWEWQARTSDAEGFGPWSGSAYFTMADKPDPPGITSPASGVTIPDGEEDVVLTHADSPDFVEVEVLDQFGGVVTDTNAVAWATTVPDIAFPVEVNATTVTLRARVKKDGLWSDWTSQTHPVSYTSPATPTVTLATLTVGGEPVAIRVSHENPTPTGSQPDVASVEVWRRTGDDTGPGIRVAMTNADRPWQDVDPDGDFDDYLTPSGQEWAYRVIAWSADNIAAASDWVNEIFITAEVDAEGVFIEGESP